MREFELKLSTGQRVVWQGSDGIDAARRYVAAHPDSTVVATRSANRSGLFIEDANRIAHRIIEPGHPQWGEGA